MAVVSITTKVGCSVRCAYCPQNRFVSRYKELYTETPFLLSVERFKNYLDKIPKHVRIRFSGYCEPFDNPLCFDLIKIAQSKSRKVELWSTFKGCSIECVKHLIAHPIYRIVVHLPDNRQLMPGLQNPSSDYIALLKLLLQKYPRKIETRLLADQNLHSDLAELIPLLEQYHKGGRVVTRADNLQITEAIEEYTIQNNTEQKRNQALICRLRSEGWFLLPNGFVHACCNDWGLQLPIGDLNNSHWRDFRNGNRFALIRKGLVDGQTRIRHNFPCEKCHDSKIKK